MVEVIKSILKKIVPLQLRQWVASYRYGFFGPYAAWADARSKATGYDSEIILNKVCKALLKVKKGEAAYERDSTLFYHQEYSWPLLATLLRAAGERGNKLNIIDFGGSLGSTYFQNRPFLRHLNDLRWNIVEQSNFVACGKENFADEHLQFFNSISECLQVGTKPSVFMFLSSIQYLEKPYEFLKQVLELNFEYLIFDRTPFLQKNEDMITLQKVPPQVYSASYPCWFLSEEKLLHFLALKYELLADFGALGGKIYQHNIIGEYRGYIFKLKS